MQAARLFEMMLNPLDAPNTIEYHISHPTKCSNFERIIPCPIIAMDRNLYLNFTKLGTQLSGEIYFDESVAHKAQRHLYATDASVYQELPVAVAIPKTTDDLKRLVKFARKNSLSLIPRTAGTSLAGQVVGSGIVVDVSKHFNQILEINAEEKWVRVQPGVIRDDLNKHLAPYGLLFGPETSTASRAMIGGMIGNNSCGLHSITWGSTRDHLLELNTVLSDGEEAHFENLSRAEYLEKVSGKNVSGKAEQAIYAGMWGIISNPVDEELIKKSFPKPTIKRRNSGYALDSLFPSASGSDDINLCKLVAGSEGTLCFVTEAKIALVDVPPSVVGVVCIHTSTLLESLYANRIAMRHDPKASELVDKFIMDFTKEHREYSKNRFFIDDESKCPRNRTPS
jgi:FAD/FMN-containing dehydrogenase